MFALRGIAVSLTFFVLIYCFLSAAVVLCWRWLRWLKTSQQSLADLLFTLRILPLVAAVTVTGAFVIPSFQILEPRSADEGTGTMPLVLGFLALALIGIGCYRVIVAQTSTSRIVAKWLEGAQPIAATHALTFRSQANAPPLTLVGMRKPKVLVSDSTLELLSRNELEIALKHELAHIRSCDNLKKLIFRFSPFPGMTELESAWSQTAELAADDAAVSSAHDAVDLAAALIKLSRLIPSGANAEPEPVCTVGFVTGTVTTRVVRLLTWEERSKSNGVRIPRWAAIPPVIVALSCALLVYGPALTLTHQLTEWMVH